VRDARDDFGGLGIDAIGVSPDKPEAQKKFDDKFTLGFPLLSDAEHAMAEAYGAWGEKNMYGKKSFGIIRSSFLIDEKGTILGAWYKVSPADTVPAALELVQGKS
jgi:peroxiredoxin Q/BCP